MQIPFRRMWDSMVRWSFGSPSIEREGKTAENETGAPIPQTPMHKHKKRKTDDHVFFSSALDQPRAVPSLLVKEDKSDTAEPIPLDSQFFTTISSTTYPLDPLATRPPNMSSPSSNSSLSSPPSFSTLESSPGADHSCDRPAVPSTRSDLLTTGENGGTDPRDVDLPNSNNNPITVTMTHTYTSMYPDPDPVAEAFLEPVRTQLKKLRLSTASAAPPPNMSAHFRVKSHPQLVRERLEPVGRFIVEKTSGEGNGALEMRICHHIAKHHWPLPTPPGETTPLRIHEMYRNALYKRTQLALRPPPPPPPAVQPAPQPGTPPPPREPDDTAPDETPALASPTSLGRNVKCGLPNGVANFADFFHKPTSAASFWGMCMGEQGVTYTTAGPSATRDAREGGAEVGDVMDTSRVDDDDCGGNEVVE